MKKILATLGLLLVSGLWAQAKPNPVWSCQLETGKLYGHGFSFIVTRTVFVGEGVVTCTAPRRDSVRAPVNVELSALGLGVVFGSVEEQKIDLLSASVGVKEVDYVFGTYPGLKANLAVLKGEASLAMSFGANEYGVGLNANLLGTEITKGFKLGVSGEAWSLTLKPAAIGNPWEPGQVDSPRSTPAH